MPFKTCKTCKMGIKTKFCPDCGAASDQGGLLGLRTHIAATIKVLSRPLDRMKDNTRWAAKRMATIARWRGWLDAVDVAIIAEQERVSLADPPKTV
jgi:hypothetical protein